MNERADFESEQALETIRVMAEGWQGRCDSDTGWDALPGSALFKDDAKTAPMQTSHLAQSGLLAAIDNLQALMALTVKHRTVHAFAPATLVRAVLECASMTVWVLEPEEQDERILRTLRWSTKNLRDRANAYQQLGLAEGRLLERRSAQIRQIATSAGVDEHASVSRLTSTEAVSISDKYVNAQRATSGVMGMWQLTSGYAHGRKWAPLAFSARQMSDTSDPGTVNLRYLLDYPRLLTMTLPAVETIRAGLDLFDARSAI